MITMSIKMILNKKGLNFKFKEMREIIAMPLILF